MPRRNGEDVDWYVEMSEWLERRDRRRKWIVLGICVGVPLLLMGLAVGGVVLTKYFPRIREIVERIIPKGKTGVPRPETDRPRDIQQDSFYPDIDIRFIQMDANGTPTTLTHAFRELLPEHSRTFTIEAVDEIHGKIRLYRLRNAAGGETYDFPEIPVRKIGTAGWTIESEIGWKVVRDKLQGKLGVQLGLPLIGRD